ncbi:hypothetical protein [Streptomyces lutosisoli]|uniref:Uncharacterized protein n=1 Tax=Streptomyces lutosisoli TaxID=2665721 RepID=A0ABW2VZ09_9ACTN
MHAPTLRLTPRPPATLLHTLRDHLPSRRHIVCDRPECGVAWKGEEADCWNCGNPATSRHFRRTSALQRLLDQVCTTEPRERKAAAA